MDPEPMTGDDEAVDRDVRTIGQLAAAAGVNVETIRYYERRGLLSEPPRTSSGYRQYPAAHLWRLQFIARGKQLGFTLAEIAELLGDDDRSAATILAAARAKIDVVDAQVGELRHTRARLERLTDLCEGGDLNDCRSLRLAD